MLARENKTMKLNHWLFDNKISVTGFADKLGITRTYIHYWMTGQRKPALSLLKKIATETGGKVCDFEDLLDER
jgi:transcriptional regulator with XRE-family HTH domain